MAALMAGCFSIAPAAQALPVGGISDTAVIAVNDKGNCYPDQHRRR